MEFAENFEKNAGKAEMAACVVGLLGGVVAKDLVFGDAVRSTDAQVNTLKDENSGFNTTASRANHDLANGSITLHEHSTILSFTARNTVKNDRKIKEVKQSAPAEYGSDILYSAETGGILISSALVLTALVYGARRGAQKIRGYSRLPQSR